MRFLKSLLFAFLFFGTAVLAQNKNAKEANPVFVDKGGVLRWTKTGAEAAFFGVNYTVPFAYGYRSHKALRKDLEKAIDADVYHMARLGLDAFRVHVWDTEISDSLGNLKANEHLKLFDYLLYKLKERHIKILITPLAFWGNGYPEPDEKTGSFSSIWNKQQVLVTEAAVKAQEVYVQQFLKHVNPYTKKTYGADEDVIALEINNEPHHSGTKQQASDYIARMVRAVKSTGWTKPIFYNISESPRYADAVANAAIDGVSFQWYPTGLVSGHTLKGNYLPNVDVYAIPFDTIPAYKNKARMVYEFDAGDVLQSYMYPAMARSFRTAGFQWATQFAYDPMATAFANTEYQTHYVNLAYTPSKAISLLIAAKAFHQLPRLQAYGGYPADTIFKHFRVSYQQSLSEMNSDTAFYYSNFTNTAPVAISKLQHIAGVGNSPVVVYSGSGAYFLDKLSEGVWRLEVMPDAISIRDPFEKASLKKEVTRIEWNTQHMALQLPGLSETFFITPVNSGNNFKTKAGGKQFQILPGTYIISNGENNHGVLKKFVSGAILLPEYVAPPATANSIHVSHLPLPDVSAGRSFTINASITGIHTAATAEVELRPGSKPWKTIPFKKERGGNFKATVPADIMEQGLLNYRIIIRQPDGIVYTFPGAHQGDPFAWDNYHNETYETPVVTTAAGLSLFNATADRNGINLYNPDWRNNTIQYTTTTEAGQLALRLTAAKPAAKQQFGFQLYAGDKLRGRIADAALFERLLVNTSSTSAQRLTITLITKNSAAFSATVSVDSGTTNISIPLTDFKQGKLLLLPRPYPGFMPLYFNTGKKETFSVADLDKLQVTVEQTEAGASPASLEIQSIQLVQKK